MDKCHWGWRPAERPQTEDAPALVTLSWTCPKETSSSPENCQSLSSLPFTLCNLSLSFSMWCYQDRDPNLHILFHFSPCFLCMMSLWCPMSPPYSEALAPLGRGNSKAPASLRAPFQQTRRDIFKFTVHSSCDLWGRQGRKSKQSCYLSLQNPYLLTSAGSTAQYKHTKQQQELGEGRGYSSISI